MADREDVAGTAETSDTDVKELFEEISKIIETGRQCAAAQIGAEMTMLYLNLRERVNSFVPKDRRVQHKEEDLNDIVDMVTDCAQRAFHCIMSEIENSVQELDDEW
jgi:hypothetical protein